MPAPTICAIIPTYNRSAMLRECVESLLAQTRPPDQIIIVNDGSTDNTEQEAKSFGERILYFSKPNGGKCSAINFAMPHCSCDYVWICDDDDLAAKDGLEHLAKALDADPSLGFVFGHFRIFEDTPQGRRFFPPTYWRREEEPNPKINFLEEMFTFQFAMLVRRSLYQAAGTFREDLARSQDYEMTLRLVRRAKSAYVPHDIFFQRRHSGARGSAKDKFAAEASMQKWLEYDQKVFSALRSDWALDEFTPTFALQWNKADAARAALVEKACVTANRALWNEAIADLRQAVSMTSQPPSHDEIHIAEVIIRSILPWNELSGNDEWIGALRAIYTMNDFGHGIVLALCRPLVWHARKLMQKGRLGEGLHLIGLLQKIIGRSGTIKKIAKAMVSRSWGRRA